ncbi:LysE family transporter, partial [bacterium]|nr:LysE family transporter [bacterium]
MAGSAFGLTAAVTPGPLLVLIMSETVKFGRKAGIQIAFVPLISDLPIVLISLLLLSKLDQFNNILHGISIVGALYLFVLAAENISATSPHDACQPSKNRAIFKGIMANYLSPHAYLFWLVLGGPLLLQA